MKDVLWIIDPLDGTTNFAHHLPLFVISIAAYRQEEVLCGVIFQPITQELFIAEAGKGAFLNGHRLKVSRVDSLEECFLFVGWPHEVENPRSVAISEKNFQFYQSGMRLRSLGSAALSLAYVAAGKADAFWMNDLYPWDIAAGQLLIEEAGGKVSPPQDSFTSPIPRSVLATNDSLYLPLLKFMQ